jgi:anthranilate synthase component 1
MDCFPSLNEFRKLAKTGNLIPVYVDLTADFETPVSVYTKLRARGPAYLLESIEGGSQLYRYSFIGGQPIAELRADASGVTWQEGNRKESHPANTDPLALLREKMSRYRPVEVNGMPRFLGGAVGYLGYEYIHRVEPAVQRAKKDVTGIPEALFMLTDKVVIFDRANQSLRLCKNVLVEENTDEAYTAACRELEEWYGWLRSQSGPTPIPIPKTGEITIPAGNFTRERFCEAVEKTREFIRAGDVIQVVLSQRFEEDFPHSPLDLYRALRTVNPSPYMFCFDTGEFALVGASPEVHVRLTDKLVEIRPIAGTRPRGATVEQDLANEKDLLADTKERAEHLMLVDLARNDIGRVCEYGSVHVPEYMAIERYSHVMHIVSQVEGKIAPEFDAYDLMRATFPAGTVSGAPKVRAMQIISELEGDQRGPYAGALGYFGFNGNLDSCIAIRTALVKDGRIYIQSGAGLVADSVPENEYIETVNKAKGMLKAVQIARQIS